MKRLTCEMCGSTDLVKDGGVFVCQSCGCKYSVEEAKRMMVEVAGAVQVKNAAQLENLLKMANSSLKSKNYAKAEEFCNQVIAMDDQNYEAWKIKGQAINHQISVSAPRILEVYECTMTYYRLLNDNSKTSKKKEILSLLRTYVKEDVDFWMSQLNATRLTAGLTENAIKSITDCCQIMKEGIAEFSLEEDEKKSASDFVNSIIVNCYEIGKTWRSKARENYSRGARLDSYETLYRDTDVIPYRPTREIGEVYIQELDCIISILQMAENVFDDETDPGIMRGILGLIGAIEREACKAMSYEFEEKIKPEKTSVITFYGKIKWRTNFILSTNERQIRYEKANEYDEKEDTLPLRARELRRAKYWNAHKDQQKALEDEKGRLDQQIEELNKQIDALKIKNKSRRSELDKEMRVRTPTEIEAQKQDELVVKLECKKESCGIFKWKEKKEIIERLENQERPRLAELQEKVRVEEAIRNGKYKAEIAKIIGEETSLQDQAKALEERVDEINEELTKDR